jgi:hypothetical protein
MTRDEMAPIGENSRRMFLRNGLLVGAGAVAVGITSISLAGSAQAASVSAPRARPPAPRTRASSAPIQWEWAWCSKCQGFWWSLTDFTCPAGGDHGGAKSYDYGVYYDDGGGTGYQGGWAYCAWCSGLFYAGNQTRAGACPYFRGLEGHENINSYDYTPFYSSAPHTNTQQGWSWCSQCQGMWYANKNPRGGVCPLNESAFSHNGNGSYPYQMFD